MPPAPPLTVALTANNLAFYVPNIQNVEAKRLRLFGGTTERLFVLTGAEYKEIWPWVDNLWHRTPEKPEVFETDDFHYTGIRQRHTKYTCNQSRSKRKSDGNGERAKTSKVKCGCSVKLEVVEMFVMVEQNGLLLEDVIAVSTPFFLGPKVANQPG